MTPEPSREAGAHAPAASFSRRLTVAPGAKA
jgi:hypothetical protein